MISDIRNLMSAIALATITSLSQPNLPPFGPLGLKLLQAFVPPGGIKLENSSSIKADITDYCTLGRSNTVTRNLYNGTGWTSQGTKVNQYIALSVL